MLCQFQVYSKVTQLYIYVYPLFFRPLQSTKQSSLCYTVGPYQLSVLRIVVCMCQSQSPSLSLPPFPSVTMCVLYICDSILFLFCRQVHLHSCFRLITPCSKPPPFNLQCGLYLLTGPRLLQGDRVPVRTHTSTRLPTHGKTSKMPNPEEKFQFEKCPGNFKSRIVENVYLQPKCRIKILLFPPTETYTNGDQINKLWFSHTIETTQQSKEQLQVRGTTPMNCRTAH